MAISNTFEFIGTLNFKEPVKEVKYDSGWEKHQLSVSVNEGTNNSAFLALEALTHPSITYPIKTFSKGLFGKKGGSLEIPYNDRFKLENVSQVSDFKKIIIDLTDDKEIKDKYYQLRNEIFNLERKDDGNSEDYKKLGELYQQAKELVPNRHEFIANIDVMDFFKEHSSELKGKRVRVKGNVEINHWNGNFRNNYTVQSIELVLDEEVKDKLIATVDLHFSKDVQDDSRFKKESILKFDTHILVYDNNKKKQVFMPYPTLFNGSNYDFENPSHQKHLDIIKKYMTVKDRKKVYHLPFEVKVINGADEKEFTIDDLTEDQRSLVELGLASLKDYKGRVFGDRVKEVRLAIPVLKNLDPNGDFRKGALETNYEVDDLVFIPADGSYVPSNKKDGKEAEAEELEINLDDLPF